MTNDLVTGQRTFYVGLSGLGNETITEVPFRDSAGNDIKCSYFKIAASLDAGAADIGGIVAELSGVQHTGDMITNTLSGLNSTLEGSGICGVGTVCTARGGDTSTEWHGSNGQVCTGIKIQVNCDGTGAMTLGVTYGNLFPLNSLRLEQSYDAGV